MIATSEPTCAEATSSEATSLEATTLVDTSLDDSSLEDISEADVPSGAAASRRYLQNRVRQLSQYAVPVVAVMLLVVAMGGRWHVASASPKPLVATPTRPANAKTAVSSSKSSSATSPPKTAAADDEPDQRPAKKPASDLEGKLNLNTATEDELMLLPTVGPAKAERIVTWRKKNGGFRRIADIRRVKGFGYKTFKRLEPFLDVKGDTTLH